MSFTKSSPFRRVSRLRSLTANADGDRVAVGEVGEEDARRVLGLGRAEGGLNCKSRVHLAAKVMTESDAHFTLGVVV